MKTNQTSPSRTPRGRDRETLAQVSPLLSSYMVYVAEEGMDMEAFVLHGGHLVRREAAAEIETELANLPGKIETLRTLHPRLSGQLQFLADFIAGGATAAPEVLRSEAIFALLYAAKEGDLIPDDLPDIGYSDDAAVTEIVLFRHADFFEQYCAEQEIEWNALRVGGDTSADSGTVIP